MKLGQVEWQGRLTAAIIEGEQARLVPGHTVADLVRLADQQKTTLASVVQEHASQETMQAALRIPIEPTEVWACGCTYSRSAEFRDSEHNTREGFYHYVYNSDNRPEVFFKGTARVCVGPDEPIGLREDSQFTAPEPELAVVLGGAGNILAYTLANDVSAWDIERENPLYLPQSKTFTGCCSLGPVLVTADELTDPYNLGMTCEILRDGQPLFTGETNTGKLNRTLQVLVEFLRRSNPVPTASVLMTGTGIIVTEESALRAGDVVTIRVPEIGTLSNTVAVV